MKVESVAVALPSRKVTNDDVLAMVREHSVNFEGDLDKTLRVIEGGLEMAGSVTRTWCDATETPFELTLAAAHKAMAKLDGKRPDIVLWAGVYGEMLEPSTSALFCHELGLDDVENADIKMACDGWFKAAKVADALILSGYAERVMVVNSEFVMRPGFRISPEDFALTSSHEIAHCFPAWTLGEGAAVTVFGQESANDWGFRNITRNDLYDLCTITMPWGVVRSPLVNKKGPGVFTSYGAELRKYGYPTAVDMLKNCSGIDLSKVDILFTHSSSYKDWSQGAKDVGLFDKFYDLYRRCGNLVSAAIPAAMALAEEEGRLKRGMNVAAWVASAGMSWSTASFKF